MYLAKQNNHSYSRLPKHTFETRYLTFPNAFGNALLSPLFIALSARLAMFSLSLYSHSAASIYKILVSVHTHARVHSFSMRSCAYPRERKRAHSPRLFQLAFATFRDTRHRAQNVRAQALSRCEKTRLCVTIERGRVNGSGWDRE